MSNRPPYANGVSYGSIPVIVNEENGDEQEQDERRSISGVMRRSYWTLFASAALGVLLTILLLVVYHQPSPEQTTERSFIVTSLLGSSHHHSSASKHHHDHHKKSYLLDPKNDAKASYYSEQLVDHMQDTTETTKKKPKTKPKTFAHRYYKISKYFKGPGSPILVILGGEDSLDLPMLYPFVHHGLAQKFGAFVLSPEHRFYGKSQPVNKHHATTDERIRYLTPDQALLDFLQLIQYTRQELGCSDDRTSRQYCPVVTFGGSYPGFLSSMLRFVYPDYIDIAYASGAPLHLYAQTVGTNAYYDKVTESARLVSPQCPDAIRSTMTLATEEILASRESLSVPQAAKLLGLCHKSIPHYMKDVNTLVSEAIVYLVPAIFADFNMAFYPPGPDTALGRACKIFEDNKKTPLERMTKFFELRGQVEYGEKKPSCFDLMLELPSGHHARIMGSDWSGSGGGPDGEIWEFQCCKDLVIQTSYSEESMFVPRNWTAEWITGHCQDRFPGIPYEPTRMLNQWGFNDLSQASRILFANGLNDGWSVTSVTETDNPSLAVINFPNGAHHSELSGKWPNPQDTDDIVAGYDTIATILGQWLKEIMEE